MPLSAPQQLTFATAPQMLNPAPHRDRYRGVVRTTFGILAGFLAGTLLVNSFQVGVGWGTEGRNDPAWTLVLWGPHWIWRGISGVVASAGGGVLGGMISRRGGKTVGLASALPSCAFWALFAVVGFSGRFPWSGAQADPIPLGYSIVAVIACVATAVVAPYAGGVGAAFGRANAEHFDSRRRSLLGIRWYHFLWLPFLIHLMCLAAAFGVVYGAQWFVTAMKSGDSILTMIPALFYLGLLYTLIWLASGASRTYEALAGFGDENESNGRDRPKTRIWGHPWRDGRSSKHIARSLWTLVGPPKALWLEASEFPMGRNPSMTPSRLPTEP